ncbi:hypothetical protein [Pseudomonas sp. PA15(2017)]|uniref:hypothetical protein n=1 Tax=Pseudomonas sp. PA15(2017) TaxID=1932111 RepID=UPI0009FA5879
MDKLFSTAAASRRDFPDQGMRQIAGTRELTPNKTYRLIYQAENDAVWILTLVHGARMWPPHQG